MANCVKVDECKDWADKAAALASYAKQANDEELMKQATRIRDRAIRRAGELLKQVDGQGKRTDKLSEISPTKLTQNEVARDAGMSSHQAKQAVRVANVPIEDFEQQVESDKPPTVSTLAEQGKKSPPATVSICRPRSDRVHDERCVARIKLAAVKTRWRGGSPAGSARVNGSGTIRKDNAIKPERFLAQPRAKRVERGFSWIGDSTRQAPARSCDWLNIKIAAL